MSTSWCVYFMQRRNQVPDCRLLLYMKFVQVKTIMSAPSLVKLGRISFLSLSLSFFYTHTYGRAHTHTHKHTGSPLHSEEPREAYLFSAICLSGWRTSRLTLALCTASSFLIGLSMNLELCFYFLVSTVKLLPRQQRPFQSSSSDSSEEAASPFPPVARLRIGSSLLQ